MHKEAWFVQNNGLCIGSISGLVFSVVHSCRAGRYFPIAALYSGFSSIFFFFHFVSFINNLKLLFYL